MVSDVLWVGDKQNRTTRKGGGEKFWKLVNLLLVASGADRAVMIATSATRAVPVVTAPVLDGGGSPASHPGKTRYVSPASRAVPVLL